MTDTTKIVLSEKELSLVNDAGWFLTKHVIIKKVYSLFSDMIPAISSAIKENGISLPPELAASHPRIYKGENYLQLPYVILDYPGYFKGEHIFAIRTMFWWGNFFSITLHLSGKYKSMFEETLPGNLEKAKYDFFVAIGKDQWQHHFEENNYLPALLISKEQLKENWNDSNFIKLALKFGLQNWNNTANPILEGYLKITSLLR